MDYRTLLFNPIYAIFSVQARIFFLDTGTSKLLRVIDKTAGVQELELKALNPHFKRGGGARTQTVQPAAVVRVPELTSKSIKQNRLVGAFLSFNGQVWKIDSFFPVPSPNGEFDGEMWLLLTELAAMESVSEFESESEVSESEGDSGSGDFDLAAFEFTQATPALTWTINHNLGRNPIVYLYNLAGVGIDASVAHTTLNQVVVTFTVATAGHARLI